ncbi:MAG: hypothetical protein WDN28_07340 [Chthoniobacter sp.]
MSSAHFNVKMDPHEAQIYGPNVLSLLERAHDTLTKKVRPDPARQDDRGDLP